MCGVWNRFMVGKLITDLDVGEMLQGAGLGSPPQSPAPSPHGSPVQRHQPQSHHSPNMTVDTQQIPQARPSTRSRSLSADLPRHLNRTLNLTGSPSKRTRDEAAGNAGNPRRPGLLGLNLTGRFAINVGTGEFCSPYDPVLLVPTLYHALACLLQ